MSTIAAANSSATNAVASLLSNAASSGTDAGTPAAKATTSDPAASSSRNPVDIVDFSDRAKATLARAKTDQVAADKLTAQLQSMRDPNGKSGSASSKSKTDDASKLFDALSGSNASQSKGAPSGSFRDPSAELDSLVAAHKQADGTVKSFTKTESDFLTVPSTPEQVDYWYQTDGRSLVAGAQFFPEEAATGIAQAVQSRGITIQNAKDIPGLNFQNTAIFQGGEGGASSNITFSYNQNADIFKDPTTNYRVYSNGTVISWNKPEGDAALGVVPATGPIFWETPARPN